MKLSIPFVDQTVNAGKPADAVMSILTLVVGFAIFYLASFGGRKVTDNALQASGLSDSDDGVEVL